jgi:hypothetical protein
MEEQVREERRLRDMEEKRAAAGGVYLQNETLLPQQSLQPSQETNLLSESNQEDVIDIKPSKKQLQSEGSSLGKRFLNEGQNPTVVQQIYSSVSEILTSDETISYIAIQNKPVVNVTPTAVILTNRRFIVYSPKLLGGSNFTDYIWRDLHDAHLKEGMRSSTFRIKTVSGRILNVDYIPKKQARRLYSLAQEMEEKVREERRLRDIEEKRAAAGGVFVRDMPLSQPPTPTEKSPDDPVQKLKQLKELLEAGLITETEFEAKKEEILSRM